jgi:anti-sigma regulatory factor (Ser/Thr protein kinase)
MNHVQAQQITVGVDADLIMLRQMLRQSARVLNLSPAQQARITAAVSEVVRALIHQFSTSTVTIHCDDQPDHHDLVIECDTEHDAYKRVARQSEVQTAYMLLDEVEVEPSPPECHLTMRVRLK